MLCNYPLEEGGGSAGMDNFVSLGPPSKAASLPPCPCPLWLYFVETSSLLLVIIFESGMGLVA